MRKMLVTTVAIAISLVLTGCKGSDKESVNTVEKITSEQARKMMDSNPDVIILDVRTEEEFDSGHISGAVLIPDTEISTKAEEILTNQAAPILIYCRSGRRSALAAKTLQELGYENLYDFGGIIDWPYDIVTD